RADLHPSPAPHRFRRCAAAALCAVLAAVSVVPVAAEDPEDGEVAPEEAGFDAKRLARADSIIRHAIRAGAAPGAALVIGRHGKIVRMRGYGRTDWSPIAPVVTDSTLYD